MTFKEQAQAFLTSIQNRRRNPVKPSTVAAYQSRLDSHILPQLGALELSQIENGALRVFVTNLTAENLSAAYINGLVGLVKDVVSSATDSNGNELYPRTWNSEFMDLPVINPRSQSTPVATPASIQKALGKAKGQEKALYALLAGTGLRIGEALALRYGPDNGRDSYWSPETGTLTIRTTMDVSNGQIMSSPKTEAGIRQVDLHPDLNNYLCSILANDSTPSQSLVFTGQTGGPVRFNTLREHATELGLNPCFHAYRRFRITYLDSVGAPRGLVKFWAGHAASDVTERYIRSGEGHIERKEWAEKAGLGFQLNQ